MEVGQNLDFFFRKQRVGLIKSGECDKKVLRYLLSALESWLKVDA